ncbi:ROK family protein [Candidatus Saccharibacteria bacterium CPR2]|nr:ROK family protein [Candidatus Saccharibacteria bacterium CPR2]
MYLAIDIGGTKTLVAMLDESGSIISSDKFPTDKNYDVFSRNLITSVNKLRDSNLKAVGVGVPGIVNYQKGTGEVFGNLPWRDVPLVKTIKKSINLPVLIDNDANMAGLAEASELRKSISPAPYAVVYITISTGIGTAIVLDGMIDKHFAKSEGGHMMFLHDGKLQTWESFASGKAIKEHYSKFGYEIPEGDPAWDEIAHNLSLGIGNIMALLVPDAIVIGGGIGTHLAKFEPYLKKYLAKHSAVEFLGRSIPKLYQAKHPEQAVLYGCKIAIDQHLGK